MSDFVGEAVVLDSDDAKFSLANSEFLIKKYAAFVNNLVNSLQQPLGTIKKSPLSEVDFQTENGSNWVLCDGQDITGTALATLKSITLAPDLITEYSWLTQAPNQIDILQQSEDDNLNHNHKMMQVTSIGNGTTYRGSSAVNRYMSNRPRAGSDDPNFYGNNTGGEPTIGITNSDGDEAMPLTVKINFFIKVDYD